MHKIILAAILYFLFIPSVYADDGLISFKSAHSVDMTGDRLISGLKKKGMTVFARINHTKGAEKAGMKLRPTELIIFGNPKVGTPLMICGHSAAIDLPQKALIREDENGQVWLTYNDPEYIAKRHGISECGETIKKIKNALNNFAKAAVLP